MTKRLKIAIQSKGRLAEESHKLLEQCGIRFRRSKDKLFWYGENFPLDVIRLRDDDIPQVLNAGVCEIGIVGENVAAENRLELQNLNKTVAFELLQGLEFGQCRLSVAAPEGGEIQTLSDLAGKTIATSYPYILNDFLKRNQVNANVVELKGSVEIAPSLGIADAIADLVSTGSTLVAHRLSELDVMLQSEAGLYQSNCEKSAEQQELIDRLLLRIRSYQSAKASKYVMLHAPKSKVEEITEILPGVETPTLMELEHDSERVALHAVCKEGVFWSHLEELKQAGASAILVLPVEKMLG
ncbi:MAG: ATP phosphoribosyltransferase [Gammaproteobacteria bacterium]|nr:ATP phosphoribosyltransferase [Gammaproteobacteria bacterium]NNC97203.1 ATP phosphoribosyltransferase [Gammaproteobacteria bacterium]NNM14487.1 ATP phosphoribosyltransferase [Gammaproteobacteria bacterium]